MKRAGWAKAVVGFGVVLLVSLGLCGVNYAAFAHFNLPIGGGSVPGQENQERWSGYLVMAGLVELVGMGVGGVGLVVTLIGAGVDAARRKSDGAGRKGGHDGASGGSGVGYDG